MGPPDGWLGSSVDVDATGVAMHIDGRCHCGQISFTAEIDPSRVMVCHCTDCQTLSGSAFRVAVAAPIDTFVLHGNPKTYVKVAESGNRRAQVFCPNCATPRRMRPRSSSALAASRNVLSSSQRSNCGNARHCRG